MPGLIPDNEMAAIRAVASSSFDSTITVERNTSAPGITGLFGEALGTPSTLYTLSARVATPSGPLLAQLIERTGSVKVWVVTVDFDADVQVGDLITLGADTMKVHSVLGPNSYSTANQFVCGEVQ